MAERKVQERLKNVIMQDKVKALEDMLKVIRSEEYRLLTNFMYLDSNDLKIYMDITETGGCVLTIKAKSGSLIDIGKML